jgi:hypothetical protein
MARPLGGAIAFQQHPVLLSASIATRSNLAKKHGDSFAGTGKGISPEQESSRAVVFTTSIFYDATGGIPVPVRVDHWLPRDVKRFYA